MHKSVKIISAVLAILLLAVAALTFFNDHTANAPAPPDQSEQGVSEEKPQDEFDKLKYLIDKPGSPWWIVNRERPLPKGYEPSELIVPDVRLRLSPSNEQMKLEQKTAAAVEKMFTAAKTDNIELMLSSGYRSEALQRQFYNSYVQQDGQEAADRYSARPGTSEHQTGMAADVMAPSGKCALEECFADMPEGKWVTANAHRFGLIIRYPEGKEEVTGYTYEPWHLRYVGTKLAEKLHKENTTMEEFFDLPPVNSN